MLHRHLNHEDFTLAAIDDIIARGNRADWAELGRALRADPSLAGKIARVCVAYAQDRYAQRQHFWKLYVEQYAA